MISNAQCRKGDHIPAHEGKQLHSTNTSNGLGELHDGVIYILHHTGCSALFLVHIAPLLLLVTPASGPDGEDQYGHSDDTELSELVATE